MTFSDIKIQLSILFSLFTEKYISLSSLSQQSEFRKIAKVNFFWSQDPYNCLELEISNQSVKICPFSHGLRTPREEIAFTARPKIQSQSQIFRYGRSIFRLPHWPNLSDIFDLCLHWVSVDRDFSHSNFNNSQIKIGTELIYHISVFPSVLFSESSNSQT